MNSLGKLILRLGFAGILIFKYGIPKIKILFVGDGGQFLDPFGLGGMITLILVLVAEFCCAILVFIGFKTRFAVIPIIITMLFAAFAFHKHEAFADYKEITTYFALAFTSLLFLGSGSISVDYFLRKEY